MDQNQKLRIALVIIFSSPIRQFNLEAHISQQMLTYKQISIFVEKGDESQVKILTLTVVKLHLTRKSAVLLQWETIFWKLAWEPIGACFWWEIRTPGENSVSKIGFMLQYLKITQSRQKDFGSKLENRGP